MKKTAIIITALLTSFALAACAQTGGAKDASSSASDPPATSAYSTSVPEETQESAMPSNDQTSTDASQAVQSNAVSTEAPTADGSQAAPAADPTGKPPAGNSVKTSGGTSPTTPSGGKTPAGTSQAASASNPAGKPSASNSDKTSEGTSPKAPAENTPSSSPASTGLELKKENGVLTCLDLTKSPFSNSGLRITVDTSAKTVKFVVTTLSGSDTVDYWVFKVSDNTAEKHTYVSAMGTDYYYYFDLSDNTLKKLEDGSHADVTESLKKAGRYDGANSKMADEVSKLSAYFSAQFGKSINDAASGK